MGIRDELLENLNDFSKLQGCVTRISARELRQVLSDALVEDTTDPHSLLHSILSVLQSKSEDADKDEKTLQVFMTGARVLAEQGTTSRCAQEIVSSLEGHVRFLRPVESCELFQYFIGILNGGIPRSPKVFELLPSLVLHLESIDADMGRLEDLVEDSDSDDDDGKENKKANGKTAMNILCQRNWIGGNVLGLASAFKDASLSQRNRDLLITKLSDNLVDMELSDLPALVHQMVLLASKADAKPVLERIFTFFVESDRMAWETTKQAEASGSEEIPSSVDVISSGPDPQLLLQAEGTVLLHFLYAAKQNQELCSSIFKVVKAFGPQQSLEPFLLGLQLTLTDVQGFEEPFLDNARSSVSASFRMASKFYQSAWIRSLMAAPSNVQEMVMRTAEQCCDGRWDCVCSGLLKFGLSLLDAAAPKGGPFALRNTSPTGLSLDSISAQMSRLGARILRLVFKRMLGARADLLEALISRIVSHAQKPTWGVYTRLLERLIGQFTQLCSDHVRCLSQPLDYLSYLSPELGRAFIHAILPLLRADQSMRNHLMIVLRKALFLGQQESRSVGVSGLLLLLQHLRVVGTLSTQSSLSSSQEPNFVCSQAIVHLPSSASNIPNDALCTELLALLRRCLDHQNCAQRALIYSDLVDVLPRNKQLAVSVMSLLKARFDLVFESDGDVQPPIRMEENEEEPIAVLISRLGRGVRYCQSQLLQSDILDETDVSPSQLGQICAQVRSNLRSVIRRMGRLDTDDVGIRSSNMSQSNTMNERPTRHTALATSLCNAYDALMEFEVDEEEDKISTDFSRLFLKQQLFRKILKDSSSTSNKSKRGRPSPSSVASSSPSSTSSVFSLSNLLVAISRCLKRWGNSSENEEQNEEDVVDTDARSKLILHLFNLANEQVKQMIKVTPRFGAREEDKVKLLADLASVSLRHFAACISQIEDGSGVSDVPQGRPVMAASLELAMIILSALVEKAEEQVGSAVKRIELDTSSNSTMTVSSLVKHLKSWCESLLKALFDASVQRDICQLLPVIVALCQHRVADHLDWLGGLCDWLAAQLREEEAGSRRLEAATVKTLLAEAFTVARLAKPGHCLLREVACDLHCRLGDVDENTSLRESSEFAVITSRNGGGLVILLTSHIEKALDDCDWLLNQLRLMWPRDARKQKKRSNDLDSLEQQERALCLRLGYICNVMDELVQSAVSPGPQADAVTSCLTRLYTSLGNLTKHYLQLTKDKLGKFSAKFEKLVRLSGTCLSPHSYAFISFIQTTELEKAREAAEGKESKKKKNRSMNKSVKKLPQPAGLNVARSVKDSRTLPSLIFAIEQYERFLIQLTRRSKVDLMQNVKMSTSRDFRINPNTLAAVLARDELSSEEEEEQEEQSQVVNQSGTELSFGEASRREDNAEQSQPPVKVRRLGSRSLSKK